ncbi:MAG: SDR family oxidoreductase [Steroidobacteraceae bacterium]
MLNRFENKVAIVTGAGQGIGEATAERLIAEGGRVVLADISGKQNAVAERLGERALGAHCDVTNAEQVEILVQQAVERFGGLHVMINNVGLGARFQHVADISESEFDWAYRVNLKSAYLGLKYAIPAIVRSGGGAVVSISSAAGMSGFRGLGAYSAMKSGILGITRAAAAEYAHKRVRVNCVVPGMTRTVGALDYFKDNDKDPNELFNAHGITSMLGRVGEARELAAAIAFLSSDDASYITAHMLPVDGGMMASPGHAYTGD